MHNTNYGLFMLSKSWLRYKYTHRDIHKHTHTHTHTDTHIYITNIIIKMTRYNRML